MRSISALLALAILSLGCDPAPKAPPSASWQRRELKGISLEAPYEFILSGERNDKIEKVVSVRPRSANPAIEIRVDAMRFPQRTVPLTLDEFAKSRFSTPESSSQAITSTKVAGLDARRASLSLQSGTYNEGVVFIQDGVYWHIDIYCLNRSLAPDADRAITSIQLR